jgi:NADPH:quinone reductase-like Zn-dependent oxidoreductase
MRAVRIHAQAGPEALAVEEAPYPHIAENDVVVRVYAAGFTPGELNWPSTWKDRAGRDRGPVIPGHEVSGEVAELGIGTTGLTVGQRVFGLTDWTRDGTLAEYVAVEARNLAPLPAGIDHICGAALPMPGLTAWQALFAHAGLRPGQTVLVHGAGGAVGDLAVQLAREAGARIIGTGRERDRAAVQEAGAERFAALDAQRFEEVAGQVDVVLDMIGGDVLDRSAAVVQPGGTLVSVAAPPRVRPAEGRAIFSWSSRTATSSLNSPVAHSRAG